jgi:hypothetical protein
MLLVDRNAAELFCAVDPCEEPKTMATRAAVRRLAQPAKQRRSWSSLRSSPAASPMSVNQSSAGTAFEVKCPFAIDAIAGVYRGDSAGQAIAKRDTSRNAWPPAKLEKRRCRLDLKRDTPGRKATRTGSRFQGAKKREDTGRKNPADSMYGKPRSNGRTCG